MKNTRIAFMLLAALLFAPSAIAGAETQDPHLAKAMELRVQALSAYDFGDYDAAAELARQAKAELALIQAAAPVAAIPAPEVAQPEQPSLPASYSVRRIPGDRDCLSKIAGYPFVYGDRAKWTILYKANKNTLKHPEDADIILPGEVLVIPSIAGELREGEYDPGKEYPDLALD